MRRVERGDTIPQPEHLSWLRRFDEKLRGIYAAVTCRRSSDVAIPRPAHRPPRPSLQRSEPRTSVHHSEPRPSQPGSSSLHHRMELGNTTLYNLLNIVGSHLNFTCFTILQSATSRNSSCIQCSHRCLVVLVHY